MSDITGQINAKRLSKTGITEDILTRLADAESGEITVVANIRYEDLHKKRDGSRKVGLVITEIEPAVEQIAEDHLRGVQRALFMNRKLNSEDATLPLDGSEPSEPTVSDVVAKGRQFTPHDYEDDPTDTGHCNVCGNDADHQLHQGELDKDAA